MSWWAEKIAGSRPPAPRAPQSQTAWWQPPRMPSSGLSEPPGAPASPSPSDYAPDASGYVQAALERCPRCGSDEYVEILVDATYGGRGGKTKRCFECRYPGIDPSGEVIRGRGGVRAKGTKLEHRNVRQAGDASAGSWAGQATWDAAQVIA